MRKVFVSIFICLALHLCACSSSAGEKNASTPGRTQENATLASASFTSDNPGETVTSSVEPPKEPGPVRDSLLTDDLLHEYTCLADALEKTLPYGEYRNLSDVQQMLSTNPKLMESILWHYYFALGDLVVDYEMDDDFPYCSADVPAEEVRGMLKDLFGLEDYDLSLLSTKADDPMLGALYMDDVIRLYWSGFGILSVSEFGRFEVVGDETHLIVNSWDTDPAYAGYGTDTTFFLQSYPDSDELLLKGFEMHRVEPERNTPDWKNAYASYFDPLEGGYPSAYLIDYKYYPVYINDDEIPEILRHNDDFTNIGIWTCDGQTVDELIHANGMGAVSFIERSGYIFVGNVISAGAGNGYMQYYESIHSIENGRWVSVLFGRVVLIDENHSDYFLEEKAVGEEEYNAKMNQYGVDVADTFDPELRSDGFTYTELMDYLKGE